MERTPWINKVVFVVVVVVVFLFRRRLYVSWFGFIAKNVGLRDISIPISFTLLSIEANFCRRNTW